MLCRVTNDQPAPWVIYNLKQKAVFLERGGTADVEIDAGTFERLHTLALVQQGPQIEVLRADEQEPEIEVEEAQPPPLRKRLPPRRRAKRKLRLPAPSPVIEAQEDDNG